MSHQGSSSLMLRDVKHPEEKVTLTHLLVQKKPPDLGSVLLGLSYLPTAQRMSFSVNRAASLKFQEVAQELEQFSEECFKCPLTWQKSIM